MRLVAACLAAGHVSCDTLVVAAVADGEDDGGRSEDDSDDDDDSDDVHCEERHEVPFVGVRCCWFKYTHTVGAGASSAAHPIRRVGSYQGGVPVSVLLCSGLFWCTPLGTFSVNLACVSFVYTCERLDLWWLCEHSSCAGRVCVGGCFVRRSVGLL